MRTLVRRALAAVALLASAVAPSPVLIAQATPVELPLGTGRLHPGPQWTVLRAPELEAPARPTDPGDELARSMLLAVVDGVRSKARTGAHVLLHAAGPKGELRLVNAYAVPGRMRAAALREEQAIADLRRVAEQGLAAEGTTVTFEGHTFPELWSLGGIRLRFGVRADALQWRVDYHAVPAGDALQLFEALHFANDDAADAEIATLLRTFDGARETAATSLRDSMLYGALGGLAAGMALALFRRRKAAAAAGTVGARR